MNPNILPVLFLGVIIWFSLKKIKKIEEVENTGDIYYEKGTTGWWITIGICCALILMALLDTHPKEIGQSNIKIERSQE